MSWQARCSLHPATVVTAQMEISIRIYLPSKEQLQGQSSSWVIFIIKWKKKRMRTRRKRMRMKEKGN